MKSNLSRTLAAAAVAVFCLTSSLSAANFYIAQSALGSGNGSTAANAAPCTFFNSASNWSSTPGASGKISPGSIVYLVGTISSQLVAQGSGTSGNVITILFQPGAILSSPAWPVTGAIYLSKCNYITIDGGGNGIIQNTANGTNLSIQQDSVGVYAIDCHYFTVQNLTVANIYVHVPGSDPNFYGTAIEDTGSNTGLVINFTVTNCLIHDAGVGIYCDYGAPGCTNYVLSYNTIYNCNWGGACGDRGPAGVLTNLVVHDNTISNFSNWDQNSDALHHNGFYAYSENGGTLESFSFYNNTVGPNFGSDSTAGLFSSGPTAVGPYLIYNNLFLENSGDSPDNGLITIGPGPGSFTGVYNNTFIGGGVGNAIQLGSANGGMQTYDVRNNLADGIATFVYVGYSGSVSLTSDYNDGYNLNPGLSFSFDGGDTGSFYSFAQWQKLGYDVHGTNGNPNLNNLEIPQPPSAAINSGSAVEANGTPLTSIFTTDKLGVSREQGSGWDIGAYEYASGAPVFTTQPSSQSVATGGTATFTVAATGTPSPTFEWFQNSVYLGATGPVLTLSPVSSSNAGTYTAVASNSAGTAVSNGAVLTVSGGGSPPPVAVPAITSALTASATVGSGFSYSITASNSPTSYNASGLPGGLSVNTASGVISGIPTSAGTFTVAITASNSSGTGAANLTLTVHSSASPAPVVTSAGSASGTVGSAFSYSITATNSPTSYNASGLPAGLSVNTASGVISGTPTGAGTSSVTISASNSSGTGSATLTLTVGTASSNSIVVKNAWLGASGNTSSATVSVSPAAGNLIVVAVSGYYGSYANHTVTDNKGSVYTRVAGSNISSTGLTGSLWYLASAPAGLSSIIGSSGSGSQATTVIVHEVAGASAFTSGEATATTASGTTNPRTPSITNGTANSIFFALCANSSGSNPATISINGSGTIGSWSLFSSAASQDTNGAASIAASVPNLIVTSSQAEMQGWTTASDFYGENNVLVIAAFHATRPTPVITSASTASATAGSAFSYSITASNSPTSYGATGLPPGLSLNSSTGVISGSPTGAGTFTVTISATNAGGTGSGTLTLTVGAASSTPIAVKNAWLGASASTSNATVPVSPAAGNLIVVAVSGFHGGYANHTVTDNMGSVYTRVAGANVSSSGLTGSLWYLANAPAGLSSIIGSSGSGSQATTVIVHEVAGASAFTSGEAAATTASGTTNPCTPSITNGTANSIFFALCANSSGANPATISINGSGTIGTWNLFNSTASQETNGASYIASSVPNLIVSSSRAEEQGWTAGSDPLGEENVLVIAAFHSGQTAPVITSATTANATVGTAFSYSITASNSPTSYGATGLPAGLSLNSSTGSISGTPSAAGTSTVTISARNASGTGSATLTLTVGSPSSSGISVKNAWLGSAGATSAAVSVSPTAGNLIVVAVSGYTGSYANHTVTDNIGSVYTRVAGANVSATDLTGSLWYLANAPAGITSIVGSSGSTSQATTVIVHSVSGVSAFTSGEAAATTASGTTNPRTLSITNHTPNSILFALCANSSSSNPALLSINGAGTIGTWNLFSSAASQETNGAAHIAASVPNLIVASSQADEQGWTTGADDNGEDNVLIIAAFH